MRYALRARSFAALRMTEKISAADLQKARGFLEGGGGNRMLVDGGFAVARGGRVNLGHYSNSIFYPGGGGLCLT